MTLREVATRHLVLKLLSLLLAAVMWLFVALEREDEVEVVVPLRLERLPAGLALYKAPLPQVLVRLAGPRLLLLRQQWQPLAIPLDLAGVREGKVAFTSLERSLKPVPGVRVVRIQPAALELIVVRRQQDNS
jgi:hypothetical protein